MVFWEILPFRFAGLQLDLVSDLQKSITCMETLAQLGILHVAAPGCQFNHHPRVTTLVPKLLQTRSLVQANHHATLWRNSVFFQLFQVLTWMVMSQAMTIRKLMIFLRLDVETNCPTGFHLQDRLRLPLSTLWSDRPSPTLVPPDTKIPWELPNK